jgi:hypothetical protein
MAIRLTKPWQALTPETVRKLPAYLGVYELADAEGRILFIGYAGGRSLFGLRSELERALGDQERGATQFRCEFNMQYLTRYQELLMLHVADHGALPPRNPKPPRLGRLRPL